MSGPEIARLAPADDVWNADDLLFLLDSSADRKQYDANGVTYMIAMATEKDSIPFSSLFSPADVICQTGETDRDGILLKMLHRLSQQHNIGNIEDAYEAVLAREKDLATVVGPGLALPHARLESIDEIVMAMATSRRGIVFDPNKSDNPVKLIVLTLSPKSAPGAYLQTLSCVARICQDASTADVVADLPTPQQVWEFFDQGGITHVDRPGSGWMGPVR